MVSLINFADPKDLLLIAALALGIMGLAVSFINMKRVSQLDSLRKTLDKIHVEAGGETVLKALLDVSEKLDRNLDWTSELQSFIEQIRKQAEDHVQRIGIVRYNAFDQMGADLSFSAAVLDANGNGFVLSGLYGREDTRVYCKPVHGSQSTYLLTDEERQAITLAAEKTAIIASERQEPRLRRAK